MICLQLYWSYLKIGFCSFGGLSMIPFINQAVSYTHLTLPTTERV